jgi:hypothetical protein
MNSTLSWAHLSAAIKRFASQSALAPATVDARDAGDGASANHPLAFAEAAEAGGVRELPRTPFLRRIISASESGRRHFEACGWRRTDYYVSWKSGPIRTQCAHAHASPESALRFADLALSCGCSEVRIIKVEQGYAPEIVFGEGEKSSSEEQSRITSPSH